MKFFRDSYRLTVSACEHFCTNHISTTVYVVVYTVVGLSSSFVYHKNQFYRSFSGGSPPQAGRAIRSGVVQKLQFLDSPTASIPNPYASSKPNCICTTKSHCSPLTARLPSK